MTQPVASVADGERHAALQLVFSLTSDADLLCNIPLVCKAWHAAAVAAYCSTRTLSRSSLQLHGSAKAECLGIWLQRNADQLVRMHLAGIKHSVTPTWWATAFSARYNRLQQLSLRSCGSPELPLQLLAASSTSLRCLRLEYLPCSPQPPALAALTQLTSLLMRSCQLSLDHLISVGQLTRLRKLALPGNSFVLEQITTTHTRASSVVHTITKSFHGSMSMADTDSRQLEQQQIQRPTASSAIYSHWHTGLQQLQQLDLSDCRLQEGVLDQLTGLTALKELQLKRAGLDAKGCISETRTSPTTRLQRLAVGAGSGRNAEWYSKHVMALGADAAVSCAVVGQMWWLIELDVSHISNAVEQLCAGARKAGGALQLRKLDVSYTACTQEQLNQLVAYCTQLRELRAVGNHAFDLDAGVAHSS